MELKEAYDLVCPICGANDPIFEADYKFVFRPIIKNDDNTYDLHIEYSIADIIQELNRLLQNGQARCRCRKCGARIHYLK